MAGQNGDTPDEIEAILNNASETDGTTGETDLVSDQSEALQRKPETHGGSADKTQQQPEQDWKARFTELKKRYDPVAQKRNELEAILKNPELLKFAKQNPQLSEALRKAGFSYADDVADEYEREGVPTESFDPERNPMHRVAQLEMSIEYDRQELAFERKLGRDLKPEEKQAVYAMIHKIPRLNIEQAYTLTPFFAKAQKEAEEKRLQEALKKLPAGKRPAPRDPFNAGRNLDLKKDVRDMKDPAEIAAKLQDIMDAANGQG